MSWVSVAFGIATGVASFLGDDDADEAAKLAAQKNIELLNLKRKAVALDLYHDMLTASREGEMVEGQQVTVLNSMNVKGTSVISSGLVNETRTMTARSIGKFFFEADIKNKLLEAKIMENRQRIDALDSPWRTIGQLATAVNRGINMTQNVDKLSSIFGGKSGTSDIDINIGAGGQNFEDSSDEVRIFGNFDDTKKIPRMDAKDVSHQYNTPPRKHYRTKDTPAFPVEAYEAINNPENY